MGFIRDAFRSWLGINRDVDYFAKSLQDKIDDRVYQSDKRQFNKDYAECFKCGARCRTSKMKAHAVFEKDVIDHSVLNSYTLDAAYSLFSGDHSHERRTKAIFICNRCPDSPPQPRSKNTYHNF